MRILSNFYKTRSLLTKIMGNCDRTKMFVILRTRQFWRVKIYNKITITTTCIITSFNRLVEMEDIGCIKNLIIDFD